jgi:hypothetical protein
MSPTNEEIYNTVRFNAAVNNPLLWLHTAESLRLAAHRLGWDRDNEESTPGAFRTYRLLFGLAMEHLLKGILIAFGYKAYNGKQLQSSFANHHLKHLAHLINGQNPTLSSQDIYVLENMESFIRWAGRYPMAKTEHDQFIRSYSSGEHDTEMELYERLRQHLATTIGL